MCFDLGWTIPLRCGVSQSDIMIGYRPWYWQNSWIRDRKNEQIHGPIHFFFTQSVAAHPMSFVSNTCVACWKSCVNRCATWSEPKSRLCGYFKLATPATSSTAVYNVCKVNVSRAGGSTAKYNSTYLIKQIQKHHNQEHAKFLQLNKTKGAGGSTAQQLTLADALKQRKVSNGQLESICNETESFRIHCFRCSTNVTCWRWGPHRQLGYLQPSYSLPSRKNFGSAHP